MSKRGHVLDQAAGLVLDGPRQDLYGPPAESCRRIAAMWTVLLGAQVEPRQVPLMLAAVKLARHAHRPSRDNLVDLAGYALMAELVEREADG